MSRSQPSEPDGDDVADDPDRVRYDELLGELRVMLPGVEVIFAFLLAAVFAPRFAELDTLGTVLFAVALVLSAVTVLVLLVPTALHRMADLDRGRRVRVAAGFQVAGSITLGLTMSTAFLVVGRMMFDTAMAVALTGVVVVCWLGLWYVLPRLLDRGDGPVSR